MHSTRGSTLFAHQNVGVAAIDRCLFVRHLGDSLCVLGDEMRRKRVSVILSWLSASACLLAQALAQAPPAEQTQDIAPGPSCIPSMQQVAQSGGPGEQGAARQGRGQAAQQASGNLTITAIPGVVAAGGKWTKVWQAGGNSADGILPDKDGGVLVAQGDYDPVLKIDSNERAAVAVANAKGVGSLSMDRQGRLYGAHRTERPGSTKADKESIVNAISMLAPERKTI